MTEMTNDSMGKHTGIGEVQIANEVVASIAGISASEVEGVDSMAGGLAGELAGMLGKKKLTKGVKVQMELGVVHVDMMISVRYGYSIPKTCKQVQEKVMQAINSMTGLTVKQVNVRIAGVSLEQD